MNPFHLQIESVAFENRCIDSLGSFYKNMGLYYCSTKRTRPSGNQHFYLGYHKDIEFYSDSAYCVQNYGGTIQLHACTHQQVSINKIFYSITQIQFKKCHYF